MVDSESHTVIQKVMASQGIRGPRYRLIYPWQHQRNIQHAQGSHEQALEFITRHMCLCSLMEQQIWYLKLFMNWFLNFCYPIELFSSSLSTWKNYLQWHGSRAQLVIREPELCKEILNNKDKAYPKVQPEDFVKKLIGDGLAATIEAEKWEKLRKIATQSPMPSIYGESLKTMIPNMIAGAETMLEKWKSYEGREVEVLVEDFRLFTSEVISRTAFGSSYLEGKHIFEMLMKLALLLSKSSLKINVPGVRTSGKLF